MRRRGACTAFTSAVRSSPLAPRILRAFLPAFQFLLATLVECHEGWEPGGISCGRCALEEDRIIASGSRGVRNVVLGVGCGELRAISVEDRRGEGGRKDEPDVRRRGGRPKISLESGPQGSYEDRWPDPLGIAKAGSVASRSSCG